MATRQADKTITMKPEPEEIAQELPTQRKRAEPGRKRCHHHSGCREDREGGQAAAAPYLGASWASCDAGGV